MAVARTKSARRCAGLSLAAVVLVAIAPGPPASAQDDPRIEQMQRQIETLQRELDALRTEMEQRRALPPPPPAPPAEQAAGQADVVSSGNDRISLAISGQVNRAVLFSNDGDKSKFYFVDNDNSSTRLRLVGSGRVSEDVTVGSNIEFEIESNSSADVNQNDESTGTATFKDRKLEVFAASDRFGKLWLGQGDTASNNTSEVDLSGTSVVGYSGVADLAGGQLFRDGDTEALSDVRVSEICSTTSTA